MIQVTDQRYLDQINEPFRGSFSAEVKLFFKGGARTFTDDDIFTISESETANIVADENPTQSAEITLSNYNHEFDINGTSGYFRDISDGIECQYRFGFHVIDEDGSDDIVWLDWKRRWCSGEASLAEKQITFTVADVFSTNDDDIEGYMSANYGLIVTNVFNKSTYPRQENGTVGVDFDTDLTNTVMYYQPTYTSFNEIIQSVAFASGKQFYIDHKGVVHIDDDRTTPTGVHLGIGDYFEDNEAGKEKKVKKITVSYYVPEDSTVDARPDFVREMNGTGESVTVSNDFICSLEDGNRVMSYLVNYYEKRGTFECTFRGDPRLEPLDVITIDILNSDETVQTVTGTIISVENTYDGTFESTIECRYVTTDTTDDTASITGAENFVYPLDSNTPKPASVTLTCTTSINNPTKYVWEYYNMVTSAWTQIGTGNTLTIPYNTEWLSDDVTTTFRCTVNDSVSASVGIKRIYTHATYTYLGIQPTAPSNPTTGDYYLAPSGLVYLWNGQEWVTTTRSDLLINAVADGKTLTGIEDTPLGQLIASMQGADGQPGQPGADGKPGADGQPGQDGVSITGVASYYLATSQSSGVTTETAGWTDTIQTMTETNKYLWTYQVTSFSDGHTETSTPYITGVYGDKGEQGEQGEQGADGAPAKSLILTADSYNFHTDAEGNVKPNQTITITVQKQNILDDIVWSDNKNINVPTNMLTYQFNSSVGEEVTPINELKGIPYVGTDGEGYEEYIFGTEENITIACAYDSERVVVSGEVGDSMSIPSIPDGTYSVWIITGYFCIRTSTTPPKFYLRYKTNVTDYYHVLMTNMNNPEGVAITPDSNGCVSYVGNLDWIQGDYLAMYAPYAIFASAGTTTGISAVNTQPVLVDIAKNQSIFTAKGLTTDEEIREYLDSIPYEDFASRDSAESITYPDNLISKPIYEMESTPTEGGYLANPDGTILIQGDGPSNTIVITDGKIEGETGSVTGIDDGTYTTHICIMMAAVVPQIINHKVYMRFEGDGDNILASYFPNASVALAGYRKTGDIFSLVQNLDTSYMSGEGNLGYVYLNYGSLNTDTSTRTTRAEKPVLIDITANESFFIGRGLLTDDAIREYLDSTPYEKFGTTETIDTPTSQINPALDGTPTIFTVTAGDLSSSVQIGYVQDGEQGEQGKSIDHVDTFYLATSQGSGVTVETEGWTSEPQTITNDKKYLWIYQDIYYSDNTVEQTTPYISGVYGDKGDAGSADSIKMLTLVPSTTTYEVSSRNVVQKAQTIIVEARVNGLSGSEITTFTYPENFVADAEISEVQPSDTTNIVWFKGTDKDMFYYTGDDETFVSANVASGTVTVENQSYATNLPDGSYDAHALSPAGLITDSSVTAHFAHKLYIRANTETTDVGDWWTSIKLTAGSSSYMFGMELNDNLDQPVFSGIGTPNLTGNITIGSSYLFKLTTDEWAFRSVVAKQALMVDITENQSFFTERGLTTDPQIKEFLDAVDYVEFGRTITIVDNIVWTVTPEQASGYSDSDTNTTTLVTRLPIGSDLTGYAVKCSIEGVGEDIVYINSVPTGEPAPRFFEMLDTPPSRADNNNEPFITGDHYITPTGVPMVYDESTESWREILTGDEHYALIMENCGNYMMSNDVDITSSMTALYGYFSTIYSNSIVTDTIATKQLTLNNQGVIRSTITLPDGTTKGYEPGDGEKYGVAGFCIMADGTAEFYNMYAFGIFAQGSFESDAMYTATEIPEINSTDVTSAYRTAWNSQKSKLTSRTVNINGIAGYNAVNISEDSSEIYSADTNMSNVLNLYDYDVASGSSSLTDVSNALIALTSDKDKYETDAISFSQVTVYKDPQGRMCVSFYSTSSKSETTRVIHSFRYNDDTNIINMDTHFLTGCQGAIKTIFRKNGEWLAYNATCGIQLSDWKYNQWNMGYGNVVTDGSEGGWLGTGHQATCSGWTYTNEYGSFAEKLWTKDTGLNFTGSVSSTYFGCVYDEVNDRVWWWNIMGGKMLPVEFGQDGNFRHGSRYYQGEGPLEDFSSTKYSGYYDGIHTQNGVTVITYGHSTAWAIIQVQPENGRWASDQEDFGERRTFAGFDKNYLYAMDAGNGLWRSKATLSTTGTYVFGDWEKTNVTIPSVSSSGRAYAVGDSEFVFTTSSYLRRNTSGQVMDDVISFFSTVRNKMPESTKPSTEPLASLSNCNGTLYVGSTRYTISQVQCTSSTITIVDNRNEAHIYTRGEYYDPVNVIEIRNLEIEAVAASVNVRNIFPQANNTYNLGSSSYRFNNGYITNLYSSYIGSSNNKVTTVYASNLGSNSYRISNAYINNLTLGSSSLSTSGYTSLPNGLLLQWGKANGNRAGGDYDPYNWHYPLTFGQVYFATSLFFKGDQTRDANYYGFIYDGTAHTNWNPASDGANGMTNRYTTFSAWNGFDLIFLAIGKA